MKKLILLAVLTFPAFAYAGAWNEPDKYDFDLDCIEFYDEQCPLVKYDENGETSCCHYVGNFKIECK